MNKKGDMPWIVVTLVMALVVFVVSLSIWRSTASEAGTFFSSETLKAKDVACKLDTERLEAVKPENDIDNDRRHDGCDRCVCRDSKCNNADDNDTDRDGMPDGCENSADLNDGSKISCRFTKTKDGRCIEGAASSAK